MLYSCRACGFIAESLEQADVHAKANPLGGHVFNTYPETGDEFKELLDMGLEEGEEFNQSETGVRFAGWSVILAPAGFLYLVGYGTTTSFPDPSGKHPHNWHEIHQLAKNKCPYCYAATHPDRIRLIARIGGACS